MLKLPFVKKGKVANPKAIKGANILDSIFFF